MNTKKIKVLSHLDWAEKLQDIDVKELEKEEIDTQTNYGTVRVGEFNKEAVIL